MDVGLWVGQHLHKLCNEAEESFSLQDFPEYAAYVEPQAPAQVQDNPRKELSQLQVNLKQFEFMSTMSTLLSWISF